MESEHLYKYTSAESAKKILRYKTIRWSSPRHFNDPFDMQFVPDFGFTREEFLKESLKRIIGQIHGDLPVPKPNANALVNAIEKYRILNLPMSAEIIEKAFMPSLEKFFSEIYEGKQRILDLSKAMMGNFMIFCASGIFDNLLMWSHYSDQHKGVVLRFAKDKMRHGPAMEVRYEKNVPSFMSLDELIAKMWGKIEQVAVDLVPKICLTKSSEWSYEHEWRCVHKFTGPDWPGYEYVSIDSGEIDAIYLGCRISEHDKRDISSLLQHGFSHLVVYQATLNPREFKLDFEPVK